MGRFSGRSAQRGRIDAHVVERQAHAGRDSGGELLTPLLGQALEVGGHNRGANKRRDVFGIGGPIPQPAADLAPPQRANIGLRVVGLLAQHGELAPHRFVYAGSTFGDCPARSAAAIARSN
jgi:hypothetical protein